MNGHGQGQCRPFLAPLQPSQLHSANSGKGIKRLRGSARGYKDRKVDDDQCHIADEEVENAFYSTIRAPQPDPYCYISARQSAPPLPPLQWGNRDEVWKLMCWKEHTYVKDPNLFLRHPQITPRMRAVLFEWISEVCEVYKLHRETFYLCIDFVDRYLSAECEISKCRLQLIGVTALFIAAKLEEIYPPFVKDFAYVTDQACTVDEILAMEMTMLKALKWALYPVTINQWLTLYLQVVSNQMSTELYQKGMIEWRCRDFVIPQFQRLDYIRLTQLTDLCLLDPGVLYYPYSVVAAAAFFHVVRVMQLTLVVSGYSFCELEACINWMAPFAQVIKDQDVCIKMFPDVPQEDTHNIQAHFVGIPLLEKAQKIALAPASNVFLTPPSSTERPAQRPISFD